MFKTKYAVEQRNGWWYALKCTTLFGITIWTEYISFTGKYTYYMRSRMFGIYDSEREARKAVIMHKEHIKSYNVSNSKHTKKRWVE